MNLLLIPALLLPNVGICQVFNSVYFSNRPIPVKILTTDTILSAPKLNADNTGTVGYFRNGMTKIDPVAAQLPLYSLPLKQLRITSGFGFRKHPVTGRRSFHGGVDLRAKSDTVMAILGGKVIRSGFDTNLGYFIRISHGVYHSVYGHLSRCFVRTGDGIIAGEAIGISGNTGRTTGEHLHFAVQWNRTPINPLEFLHRINNKLTF